MQTLQEPKQKNQPTAPTETLDFILDRLTGVQPYRDYHRACCPAHDDNNPSLSIKEGYRGILLKCWAGCTLAEICQATGITESALFFDAPRSQANQHNEQHHERASLNFRWNWRKQVGELLTITDMRMMAAEDFLRQVQNIDSAVLTDRQKDFLLDNIALAKSWTQLGESVHELCFDLSLAMRQKEVLHG